MITYVTTTIFYICNRDLINLSLKEFTYVIFSYDLSILSINILLDNRINGKPINEIRLKDIIYILKLFGTGFFYAVYLQAVHMNLSFDAILQLKFILKMLW